MPSVQAAPQVLLREAVPVASAPDARRAGEAEAAVASGVPVQRPEAAQPEDAAVRQRAAGQPDVREQPAVLRRAAEERRDARPAAAPSAPPSEAASVFRQAPFLAVGPVRPRAAAHLAHAMRSLRIASRSESSWQAARNESWSCGELPREGSLTKCWDEQLRVRPHCGRRGDLFLHSNHVTTATFIAHSDAGCNRLTCDASPHLRLPHPSRDLASAGHSARAVESLQARGPAIRRAVVIRRARAPAA